MYVLGTLLIINNVPRTYIYLGCLVSLMSHRSGTCTVIALAFLCLFCLLLLGIDSLEHKLGESERKGGAYMKRYNRIQVCCLKPACLVTNYILHYHCKK